MTEAAPAKRRILFVDDEQRVLDGLGNSLRRFRKQWDMTFVCGGPAALRTLESTAPFDVVVSDARMPELDGEALLAEVQRRWPDTARVILSGQTDEAAARRLLHIAHQFIAKPCESSRLFEVLERLCVMRDLLTNHDLRSFVTGARRLPTLPTTFSRLTTLLANPLAGTDDAARLIAQDASLTAKVLQVVNSAFFGLPQKMTQVGPAASYLGLETLRTVVLAAEVGDDFVRCRVPLALVESVLSGRNLEAAKIVKAIAPRGAATDAAIAACILADIGQLAFMARDAEAWKPVRAEAGLDGARLAELEQAKLGCDHSKVAAYLLALWGLPVEVVDAVQHHHARPEPPAGTALSPRQLVYVAYRTVEGTADDVDRTEGLGPSLELAAKAHEGGR
jgi:HD-like signal output (HDOD) protein/ActR/RegA family two-component response regulator